MWILLLNNFSIRAGMDFVLVFVTGDDSLHEVISHNSVIVVSFTRLKYIFQSFNVLVSEHTQNLNSVAERHVTKIGNVVIGKW
jgi:hypothetical protein